MQRAIREFYKIRCGGTQQQIYAEGPSGAPAILFIHGGPGWSLAPYCHHYLDLLKSQVLCFHWDQRGIWRSFDPGVDFSQVTIQTYVDDLAVVVVELLSRYRLKKICLSGHSWGTIMTTLYAHSHPEKVDFVANVGQMGVASENEKEIYRKLQEFGQNSRNQELIDFLGKIPDILNMPPDTSFAMRRWSTRFRGQHYNYTDEEKMEQDLTKNAPTPYADLDPEAAGFKDADHTRRRESFGPKL